MENIIFKTTDDIDLSLIVKNPENPRGKNVRENDKDFEYLKKSIRKYKGIIVPLIVQEIEDGTKYQLLDGERRFWALKECGIQTAPAHIISGKLTADEAKELMFHIHTNHSDWSAYQQCKSLEDLYNKLYIECKGNINKVIAELLIKTGTNARTLADRIRYLKQSNAVKKIVESNNELYWTVVEIEVGFIEPAEKNYPEYFNKVDKDKVRLFLLNKYIKGVETTSTDVRNVKYMMATKKEEKDKYKYYCALFTKLTTDNKFTFEDAKNHFENKYPPKEFTYLTPRKLNNKIENFTKLLETYDFENTVANDKRQKNILVSKLSNIKELIVNVIGKLK